MRGGGYPLNERIREAIARPDLKTRSSVPMKRVLDQILAAEDQKPRWMGNPAEFVEHIAKEAPKEFDRAFDRWRELYRSARKQLAEANERLQVPNLARAEFRRNKAAYNQALDQLGILERGENKNSSDFYTYRYLATEGFLPGYNFPRLPLYAFVPGDGKSGKFLSRARFFGISEFGPRSLIYHEGRAYRVVRAKLPLADSDVDGDGLPTRDIYICRSCGACHEEEVNLCHGCGNSMENHVPVRRTLRIDNVEAIPAERITANDEERVRQGFDIQTVFSWPKKHGRPQLVNAEVRCDERHLLSLQYANSAEISRINKGLKRRKAKTVFGFNINARTGWWAKSEEDATDVDLPPDADRSVRIVPIVRDRKNALLFRFHEPKSYDVKTIVTVQHALMRGIEVVHQVEEGEILGEPLPSRDDRRAILAYEATEGGAGVLRRLIEDPAAIGKVAWAALETMHFENVEEMVSSGDAEVRKIGEEACVRGCYRCLLSYYNQLDHELIDRDDESAVQFLIDLACGKVFLEASEAADESSPWVAAFLSAGLPLPDAKPAKIGSYKFEHAWQSHLVAATEQPIADSAKDEASNAGWEIVGLPESPSVGVPKRLAELLGGTAS